MRGPVVKSKLPVQAFISAIYVAIFTTSFFILNQLHVVKFTQCHANQMITEDHKAFYSVTSDLRLHRKNYRGRPRSVKMTTSFP